MYIRPLLLLGLCFRALSLTTTNEALGKRHSGAWIASYDLTDTGCKNASTYDDRTSLSNGACVRFPDGYFSGDIVGGSWGDITVIEAFADEACTASEYAVNITWNPEEKDFCTPLSALAPSGCQNGDEHDPCFWNSVKGYAPPVQAHSEPENAIGEFAPTIE